jgi:iron-sulfur cluster repair protein YtfE (RIC family)
MHYCLYKNKLWKKGCVTYTVVLQLINSFESKIFTILTLNNKILMDE